MERVFLNQAKDLFIQMGHWNYYDWMLFLTSPMVFVGLSPWLCVY